MTLSETRLIDKPTIKKDFPFLDGTIFLDSAATSQMPVPVCESMSEH